MPDTLNIAVQENVIKYNITVQDGNTTNIVSSETVNPINITVAEYLTVETGGGSGGQNGQDGVDGESAYEIAVNNGFVGTEAQWLTSLIGADGQDGAQGIQGDTGAQGVAGQDGSDGQDGDSAYQVAVNEGFVGTEAQWLASLVGAQGIQGEKGDTGDTGAQGIQGIAGQDGTNGADGQGVPTGGTAGQILSKVDGTDYNTQWVTPSGGGSSPAIAQWTNAVATNVNATTDTNINFGTSEYLETGYTDTNATTKTIDVTGRYFIMVRLTIQETSTSNLRWTGELSIRKNGTDIIDSVRGGYIRMATGSEDTQLQIFGYYDLVATDYIQIVVKRLSDTSSTVSTVLGKCKLIIKKE